MFSPDHFIGALPRQVGITHLAEATRVTGAINHPVFIFRPYLRKLFKKKRKTKNDQSVLKFGRFHYTRVNKVCRV